MELIGRDKEKQEIIALFKSKKSELLAITGRRRVGKTFLIRTSLSNAIDFSFIGSQNLDFRNQLIKFKDQLDSYSTNRVKSEVPISWYDAFQLLTKFLKAKRNNRKKIVFLDEFPWIHSHKSSFLQEFTYWWNNWASQNNILVIICGSSTSWMINKITKDKGGLHNRVTAHIHLIPFVLKEVKTFFKHKKIAWTDIQILQFYMIAGGVPFYLDAVKREESMSQAVDRLCFQKKGLLHDEFENLYPALFDNYQTHVQVIKALFSKWKGVTRNEILAITKLSNGGSLTRVLDDLITSDFVSIVYPFEKKKKEALYRLTDPYSLFYLKFIEGKKEKIGSWLSFLKKPEFNIWTGYCFENVCFSHIHSIIAALKIEGIHSEVSSYAFQSKSKKGFQIDLIIDRADDNINLCEVKFYNTQWAITKRDVLWLNERREHFRSITKTRKALQNTIITSYGLKTNALNDDAVDTQFDADIFFK